jgi:hypothetical protein
MTAVRLYQLVKMQLASTQLKDITITQFNRGLMAHPAFNGQITRMVNNVGLYRVKKGNDFFYWIGDKPKFPRPMTPAWKKKVWEAEERVFSSRRDAPVTRSNTVRAAEMDEDDTPDRRPRHDDASVVQSNTAGATEMDEAEAEDETPAPAKRLRYETVPRVTPEHPIQQQTYWDSTEALKQFFPTEDDESVLACIERRILLFSSVGKLSEAWRQVIGQERHHFDRTNQKRKADEGRVH